MQDQRDLRTRLESALAGGQRLREEVKPTEGDPRAASRISAAIARPRGALVGYN